MPAGSLKNTLYGMALPILGKRCEWKANCPFERMMHRHHVVGAAMQFFEKGELTRLYTVGYASTGADLQPVNAQTFFRTASVAKMITALLVFRLQTTNRLSVEEDISDFLGYPVRNPAYPHKPITLGMVLSHTSSIVDFPQYFESFRQPQTLENLLRDPAAFLSSEPGTCFRYSNLAAGMIACMLEKRFGISFEQLAQQELFAPLKVKASFDLTALQHEQVADSWRVLPQTLAFEANARRAVACPLTSADPQHHYLQASGNLFLTAEALAKLTLAAWNGADGLIDEKSLCQMHTPVLGWPDQTVCIKHGMGLFELEDSKICSRPLWGHQGFAYGAVNGVFFDAHGSGFVCLNSGASEKRIGHLACLNRDLIAFWMKEYGR